MKVLWPTVVIGTSLLGGCPTTAPTTDAPDPAALVIFHNNSGPMCQVALDWLADVRTAHPDLLVSEHLTYVAGEPERLSRYRALHTASQGVSDRFEYLPIIFYRGQAFSGFDENVAQALNALLPA
jgi:hypothetical protein